MTTVNRFVFSFLLVLFIAAIPSSLFGTDITGNCGTVGTAHSHAAFTNVGGRYITSQGILTSFVLFVRFAGDNETSTMWPNPAVLPPWAQNILNPNYSATGNYTLNSISHYIYENSYGKLHIVGDVYYVTLPYTESHYYSFAYDDAGRQAIQQDALNAFEAQFHDLYEGRNMSKYDNWTRTSDFNFVYTAPGTGQPKDNIVDMCWIVLRNLHDENYTTYALGEDIAQLFGSRTIDGITIQAGYPDPFFGGGGSGISLFSHNHVDQVGYNTVMRMPVSEYDNDGSHFTVLGTMVHELSHWFFGTGHFGTPTNINARVSGIYGRSSSHMVPYNVNSGAAHGNFLGYEKIRLGWITSSEIQVISTNTSSVNLPNMETTTSGTKIVKIPLDANQCIYLENRSWNSIYEARYVQNNYQKPYKPGVLAYLITYEDDYLSNTPIQQICANGKWTWNIIAGGGTGTVADNDDVIVKATPNSTTGYDEREDIHISGQGSKSWWALYYPNSYGSNYGRWYKGENYVDENHNVGDYRGNIKQPFDIGDVISPWSNGATHKWSEAAGSFVATSTGIEVTAYNSSNSIYTLSVCTSNPEQLSPSKPQNFHLASPTGAVQLVWAANSEPDFYGYEVSRKVGTYGQWQVLPNPNPTANSFTDPDYGITPTGPVISYRVRAEDIQGKYSVYTDLVSVHAMNMQKEGGAEQLSLAPHAQNELRQNFPNPFNPTATITYGITDPVHVSLKIYNSLGQEVAVLVNGTEPPGYYTISWNAANVPSGIYFYRLVAGKYSEVKKMLLLK